MVNKARLSQPEFVTLMALMTSLIALAIDSMLPGFDKISLAFGLHSTNQVQLIIAVLFLGFGFGQLIFGPLSDVYGRKLPIYWGLALFMIGSILSGFAESFELFLAGRFLQGFGGAAPRIVSIALIRDEYVGNAMAKITSLVMSIFILVPAIAPTLGQIVLYFASWRQIFILLFVAAFLVWIWFGLRQQETLLPEKRKKLAWLFLKKSVFETLSQSTTVACIIVSGLVFGIFIGYLGAVQAIFSQYFSVTGMFPLYFAILSLSIGGASFFNSQMVMKLGMRKLLHRALLMMILLSIFFIVILSLFSIENIPLWAFMIYMSLTFFCVGFLFGNLNALAMIPLGHIAGVGSALLGFLQSTLSVIIGVSLGGYFHADVKNVVFSFGVISFISLIVMLNDQRKMNTVIVSI